MDLRFIKQSTLTAIANAIRGKRGKTGTIDPANYASEIEQIETGITPTGTLQIYSNGTHDVTECAKAIVAVPQPQLYAPTISLSGSTLNIANSTKNGSFVESYELYCETDLYMIYEGAYTAINLSDLDLAEGAHKLSVIAKGTGFVHSPSSNAVTYTTTFSFTIDGTSYQAEHGMSWEEWKDSTYNTGGYVMNSDCEITNRNGTHVVIDPEGIVQVDINTPVADTAYTLEAITFSFTINGVSYTAEVGMVFADWISSDYNIDGFVSDGGTITTADGTGIELNGVAVAEEDEIMQGGAYLLGMETLTAPSIEIDGTTLNIYDEEGIATSYDILVDGVVMETVSTLITFTVQEIQTYTNTTVTRQYTFESGMTFSEWIASEYNTDGYNVSADDHVYTSDKWTVMIGDPDATLGNGLEYVWGTDTIIQDGAYYYKLTTQGSGGSN